jgi:hypothetical protein
MAEPPDEHSGYANLSEKHKNAAFHPFHHASCATDAVRAFSICVGSARKCE